MSIKNAVVIGGIAALLASAVLPAQEDNYVTIEKDLGAGTALQEVADRAYDNADDYWENYPGQTDGDDEELSAGEAVTAIYTHANDLTGADRLALDIVNVTRSVVDAWPDCQDTFDAVRAAVALEPGRADEIVANIAMKRDCNCSNGGLWLDRRVEERIRVAQRQFILDVPVQCSCSQVAMYAGIAGLPENREFQPDMSDEEKAVIIDRMVERVQVITDRTAALQSMNSWECGCTNINIAASMQGIEQDELRDGAYEGLAEKYAHDAADTGLVVDAFGVVGMYPLNHWGEGEYASEENVLLRKTRVYRGDNMILDPFTPQTEYSSAGYPNLAGLGQHSVESNSIPTDVFISEYIEGWNEEALKVSVQERDPEQRNRVLELYNGSDETIDLGNDQYFLEIYAGPAGAPTRSVVTPPVLVKKTISLESDVVFEFDKSDIRPAASEDLKKVAEVLNEVDFFSEVLIVGHTCDLGTDEYNLGLSERRANSVRDYLREVGLKDVEVRTEGHGEREPRVPNASTANRSRNRRVDISFVTRQDETIEATVSEADPNAPKKYEYTFMVPVPPSVHEVESESAGGMAAGDYAEGGMRPRQVIGLNGAIEPGETWIIAFDQSDEAIRDKASVVTGQLDFEPNETLVVRRMGGEMALNCRAQSYAYVLNYPPEPFVRYPDPIPPPPPIEPDIASPN